MVIGRIIIRLPLSWLLALFKPPPISNHSNILWAHISCSFCYILVFYPPVTTKQNWVVRILSFCQHVIVSMSWRVSWNILYADKSNFFKFDQVLFSPCLNELCIVWSPQEPSKTRWLSSRSILSFIQRS